MAALLASPETRAQSSLEEDRILTGDVLARDEAVRNRQRDDYDAIGVDLGQVFGMNNPASSFTMVPSLGTRIVYDDNVFRSDEEEIGDFFFRVRPSVEFRSEWLNNRMVATIFAERDSYFDEKINNSTDFFFNYFGRYDLADDDAVIMTSSVGRGHELRSDPNSPPGTENVNTFFEASLSLEGRFSLSDLLIEPIFTIDHFDFRQNGEIENDDRNRTEFSFGGRVGYRLREGVAVFTEATRQIQRYEQKIDNDGFARDSTGFDVRAGLRFEPSGVTYLEASAGYFELDIEDPQLDDVQGLSLNASLVWNPTDLATLRLNALRQTGETTLPGISSLNTFSLNAGLDYEVMEPLLFTVSGGYTRQIFEGDPRRDNIFFSSMLITYFVNRYLMIEGSFVHSRRDSSAVLADFVSNRSFLRARVQL